MPWYGSKEYRRLPKWIERSIGRAMSAIRNNDTDKAYRILMDILYGYGYER